MVSNKRLCRCTASNGVHHWRLNFKKFFFGELATDIRNYINPFFEKPRNFRIGPKINISLPVTHINICQTVKLLRRRQQSLCQYGYIISPYRKFTGPGSSECTFGAKQVTEVKQLGNVPLFCKELL